MYYTSLQHPPSKRVNLDVFNLLEHLSKPSSLYESLQSKDDCKLYFDIDYKSQEGIYDFCTQLMQQLAKTNAYYIYGGYTTDATTAEEFNLKLFKYDDVPKTLSIHIVFPKIITTPYVIQQFIHNNYQTQYVFDQVIYGGHDMLRHPLYNKGDYKVACDKLIDSNGNIFDRHMRLKNIQLFADSFVMNFDSGTTHSITEVVQEVMNCLSVKKFHGDFVYKIPIGSCLDPIDGVYTKCRRLIAHINCIDMKKIDDKERFEKLKQTLLKFIRGD